MGVDQGDTQRPGSEQQNNAPSRRVVSRRGFLGGLAALTGAAALAALANGSGGESNAASAEPPTPVATEVTKVDEREMGLRLLKERIAKYFNAQSREALEPALQAVHADDASFTVDNNGAGEARYMLDINKDGDTPDFTLTISDMDDIRTTELAFNLSPQATLTTSEQAVVIPENQLPSIMEAALVESESPQKQGISWRTISSPGMKGASATAKIPGKAQGEATEMRIFHTGSGNIKETTPQV